MKRKRSWVERSTAAREKVRERTSQQRSNNSWRRRHIRRNIGWILMAFVVLLVAVIIHYQGGEVTAAFVGRGE